MDAYDLIRAFVGVNCDAKLQNIRIKEFKVSQWQYDLLLDWFLSHTPAKAVGEFKKSPMIDGVPLRVV